MPSDNQSAPQKISGSETLTDILIRVEDFFDSLDLYVFKNWLDGEIVDGPVVKRYWVSITLQFEYEDMPDPSGAERLMSRGCKVKFWKAKQEEARDPQSPDDFRKDGRGSKPVLDDAGIWLVEIQVPRRFVDEDDATDQNAAEAAGVDQELMSSAQDEDIDDKTAFEAPATDDSGDDAVADDAGDDSADDDGGDEDQQ
jgi:hypothetical protein